MPSQQAIELVTQLNSPNASPETVKVAQEALLQLQKSSSGFEIAETLLTSEDTNCQFMGAVTLAIKMNDPNMQIPEAMNSKILEYLHFSSSRQKPVVLRKLLGVSAILFFRTYRHWTTCLTDVTAAVGSGEYALLFTQILIEEYVKIRASSASIPALREAMVSMLPQISEYVHMSLVSNDEELIHSALETFAPWAMAFIEGLGFLIPQVIDLLNTSDYDIFEKASTTLADLFDVHRMWPPAARDKLIQLLSHLVNAGRTEFQLPLGQLVLTVCQEVYSENLLPYILGITKSPLSLIDDELASDVCAFWSRYVENLGTEFQTPDSLPPSHQTLLLDVFGVYWRRVQIKDIQQSQWDEFVYFRRDVCELMLEIHSLLGDELLQKLSDNVKSGSNEEHPDWYEIDASLYCLIGLADAVTWNENSDVVIAPIMESQLWAKLSSVQNPKILMTIVHFIGAFDQYFETNRGKEKIGTALSFMFGCLGEPELQLQAAKSISKLCSSSRKSLSGQYAEFLSVYSNVSSGLEPNAHKKVVAAIGYVLQGMEPGDHQAAAVLNLIELIQNSSSDIREILASLAALASAMKFPDDSYESALAQSTSEYWRRDPANIKTKVLEFINVYANSQDANCCESICHIFKSGASERVENPFVFGLDSMLSFIEFKSQNGPPDCQLLVLELAFHLARVQQSTKTLTPDLARQFLNFVTKTAPVPSLKIATTIIKDNPAHLIEFQHCEHLLAFALEAYSGSDLFLLRAASQFWEAIVDDSSAVPLLNIVFESLVRVISNQIGGNANRTELTCFKDVLARLMFRHNKEATRCLTVSLVEAPVNKLVQQLDVTTRSTFVLQLSLLRGKRQTGQLVTKFWQLARGLPEY